MPKKSKDKIKNILDKILTGYCLGKKYNYCLEYSIKGLLKDVELNESELLSIMEHLDEKEVILSYIESGSDSIIKEETYKIYFPDDFKEKAFKYLSELSEVDLLKEKNNYNGKLKIEIYKNQLYIIGDKNKNKIRISDDFESRKSKLIRFLSFPNFGVSKNIESVINAIKIKTDTNDYKNVDKKSVIINTFKEIQRTLKEEGASFKIKLLWGHNSVSIKVVE